MENRKLKIKVTKDLVKSVCFMAVLVLLLFAALVHRPKEFSAAENRYLAQMPAFSVKALLDGSFMKDYETYITDQYPGRDSFIALKTAAELARGRQDGNGVYFGEHSFLLGEYAPEMFEGEAFEERVSYLTEFAGLYAEKFGPEHLQMILVPDAAAILTDLMPANANVADELAIIDWMTEQIDTAAGADVAVNAGDILTEHRNESIYYRTDHHWTTFGAWYAYDLWKTRTEGASWIEEKEAAADRDTEIKPAIDSSAIARALGYDAQMATPAFSGTFDSKVGLRGRTDKIYAWHDPVIDQATMTWDGKETLYDSIYFEEALAGKDKYAYFFGGNHGITDIDCSRGHGEVSGADAAGEAYQGKTLLVIKDSYAHSFVPFVLRDYERVIMLDLRYFNKSLSKYIEENEVTDLLVLYSLADFAEDANLKKIVH